MPMARKWRIRKREVFERIRVIGPMDEGKSCMAQLHKEGWRLTRSGPYTNRGIFPRVDLSRFLFKAERRLREEAGNG